MQDSLDELHLEVEVHEKEGIDSELDNDHVNKFSQIWTQTELTIRTVLSQLAGVPEDNIRHDTTIYRLGLDSVRAVQVASVLRKQGLQVSAVDVMEHPSCVALAGFLSPPLVMATGPTTTSNGSELLTPDTSVVHTPPSSSASATSPALPEPQTLDFDAFRAAAQPVLDKNGFYLNNEIEAVLPCTPLQAGLLIEFVRSKGKHYFNFITFELKQEDNTTNLDGAIWEKAWKHATSSIPMLRTGFISMDGASDNDDNDALSALSPFAMIQISSESMESQSRVLRVKESQDGASSVFDLSKWKDEATNQTLRNLQLPPWQMVIVEGSDGKSVTCHLAIHHALYDAASLRTLLDDVAGFVIGNETKREKTPSTNFVVSDILHQVASLTGPSSTLAGLWKERGAQTVVNSFPVLTPLKETPGHGVLKRPSSQTLSSLQAAVQNSGFTMHAVLQAAWTRILSSYVGDSSVVFGAVLSGRNTDTTERAVFPCISTLPVVSQNMSENRLLVEHMMDANILLHKSQHVPLRQIQRWLGQSDARLFDTLLVYQSAESGSSSDNNPWTVADEQAIVDYPISIEAITKSSDKPLLYQITFDTSVLPSEHACLLLEQLDAIVGHIASHPDGCEDDLAALNPGLYSVLPPGSSELPSDVKLLHEFVERQAELRPTKTALQFVTAFDESAGGVPVSQEWTFLELDARGNRVASLVSQYAEPGSIVAICFDKCPEAIFAMLGILKAGCAYLALDPGAPSSRKNFILQDAGAPLLLTDVTRATEPVSSGGLSDITEGVKVIAIDETSLKAATDSVNGDGSSSGRRPTVPSDVCYCLYTSGTTGTPKGCAITHENAVQCMLAFQELFRNHYDTDTSRWLQFASFHFDVAVLEQYWTWSVGMTLVGAPRDLILEDLAGTISRLEITHIDLTPSLGRLLDPNDVPSLCRGVFITGGEPLKQEMLDPWGPTGAVHNFYGPTEATIGVTSYPQVPQNGRASNIGRQFPNVGTLVFRPGTQTPILRGGVGELCVSGKLVGQGYLNRDELTSERFPALIGDGSVYRKDHGDRVYRTGDLVRMLYDGCFDFLGRADDQVKLRGQRLEIGEINHAIRLGLGASVGDVATLVIRDEDNKKDFLVSFVVVDDTDKTNDRTDSVVLSQQVQAACRERLPGYMVPTYVVQLTSIPLSPNNKADGKELKRFFNNLTPDERMRTTGAVTNGVAASTNTATAVPLSENPTGRIVVEVLHKLALLDPNDTNLAPHRSIFELGIDSVSVLRFARALKRAGLPSATPSAILSHPNLGDLVSVLHDTQKKQSTSVGSVLEAHLLVDACQHRNRTRVSQALGVNPDQIEYIAPCSALQQGIISRARSGPEHRDTYFNAFHFRLDSTISIQKLRNAWSTAVSNNAILRTRFVATRDGFVQTALKPTAVSLPWTQLDLDKDADIDKILKENYTRWVDANQDDEIASPLQLISVAWRKTNALVLHIFHGLYDATSLVLILGQVAAAYNSADYKSLASLEHPTFLDALVHGPLRNHTSSRAFWESHLKDRGALQPVHPLVEANVVALQDIGVERTLSFVAVEHLRVSLGVTHAALIQALWVSVLQKTVYGGSNNGVSLGLVLSGRTIDDLDGAEGVVGPLFNTLPFYAPATELSMSWAALAQACHTFSIAALPFQQTPLRDIQKWCSAGQPLFDVLFSFQFGGKTATATASTEDLWTQSEPDIYADYPLALEAVLTSTSSAPTLSLFLVAKAGIADTASLNRVLDNFESALEAISRDSSSPALGSDIGSTSVVAKATVPLNPGVANGTLITNGRKEYTASQNSFVWDDTASTLRREIACLAGVPDDAVQETTTLLELGLDSVDTIKLSARLRSAGIRLTNSQLVRRQNIAAFLDIIEAANIDGGNKNSNASTSANSGEANVASTSAALREYFTRNGRDLSSITHLLPPTPLQEAMVADMIQSSFVLYFNNDILEIAPGIDVARLKAAWTSTVAKHAILRTVFFNIESPDFDIAYCQAVKKSMNCIGECSVASKDELVSVADYVRKLAIDGEGESGLFQLLFVHTTDTDRWYLVLSIAHALYDGWSLDLLHRTVEAAYHHPEDALSSKTSEEPTYIGQLSRILQSSGPQADSFWKSFLDGAQPTYVQRQNATSSFSVQEAGKTVIRLESTSSVSAVDLQAFSRQQATSVQVIGQACWAAVLASLSGSLDLLFGVVLSGRDADEDGAAIFPTMNTVPVRIVLHGTTSELLQYMQTNMGSIGEHQYYPLRQAQRAVNREAGSDNSAEPGIFNTLFILQKRMHQDQESGESVSIMKSIGGASDVEYPICVEMELAHNTNSNQDTVVWRTACDQEYVSRHGAARLLHQLDVALRFMVQASTYSTASSPANILTFDGGGVSICGLPPFAPKLPKEVHKKSSPHEPVTTPTPEDSGEWTHDELAIRAVLSAVSGTPESGIQRTGQTLYQLGFDSISTIKVSTLLKKTKGIVLGVRALLAAGSLQEMAAMVAAKKEEIRAHASDNQTTQSSAVSSVQIEESLRSAGIAAADVETVLPATAMQVHMVSVWQNTGGDVFFPAFRYRIKSNSLPGKLSLRDVHDAWTQLVAEHPILRTIFLATGTDAAVPLLQVAIRSKTPPSLDDSKTVHFWPALGNGLFHPSFAMLSVVSETSEDGLSFLLTLRIHHAIYDAVSLEALLGRFKQFLRSPSTKIDKLSSVAWKQSLNRQLSIATTESNKKFWSQYFVGANLTSTVTATQGSQHSGRASLFCPAALGNISPLKDMAAKLGVGLQSLIFAVYAKTLSANTNKPDVVFGVYLANRDESGGGDDRLSSYPTLCLVPLLVRSPLQRSLADLAAQIQGDIYALVVPHAPYTAAPLTASLWEIQQWTGVTADSFVNFLLPDDVDASGTASEPSDISLEPVTDPDNKPAPKPRAYPALHANRVRGAYKDAVDVELAVRGDHLDIGVFGSLNRLGDDNGAKKVVNNIVSALQRELAEEE